MSTEYRDYPPEQHEVRLIVGDPVACAYEWIKKYAESLSGSEDGRHRSQSVTPEELIEVGRRNAAGDGEYLVKGGLLEGVDVDPLFWDKLEILLGIEVPRDSRQNFFSCSC